MTSLIMLSHPELFLLTVDELKRQKVLPSDEREHGKQTLASWRYT